MAALTEAQIQALLVPYLRDYSVPTGLFARLSDYLDLLLRWNARTNLTAIREPERIVERHFGESLFCGVQMRGHVSAGAALLDYGSGAGFPGLPIQLLLPELRVTLAESQGKKASFLREAVRSLGLAQIEVWSGRVESMPPERLFDWVTLRAVDRMEAALAEGRLRVRPGGCMVSLVESVPDGTAQRVPLPLPSHGFVVIETMG